MPPIKCVLLIMTCAIQMIVRAQNDTFIKLPKPRPCHKKVGYFASRKPEKLARKLTAHLSSDSEKVSAIYCWITSHIRYDVGKFSGNDFLVSSNRSILRRRKAVCYGYSTLFRELCALSGLQSVIVTGYTKNSTIDICDSFYLEDHSWNAVYLNGRWHLCDPTWDAGSVLQWKRNFSNQLLYIITLGRKDNVVNRLYFKRNPQCNYFLKSGDYFYYDHLPANPIWQLGHTKSITDFRLDSSHYYRLPRNSADNYSEDFAAERMTYAVNADSINDMNDGFAFTRYNFRNHFLAISSSQIKARPFIDELDFKSKDSALQRNLADSVSRYCQASFRDIDSNAYYLKQQLRMQLTHIAIKNNILKTQNSILRKSSMANIKQAEKGLRIKRRLFRYMRRKKPVNRKNLQKAIRDKKIYSSLPSKKPKPKDSTRIAARIHSLDSTLAHMQIRQDSLSANAEFLLKLLYPKLQACVKLQHRKTRDISYAASLRKYGSYDDFDYPIRKLKDSLMAYVEQHDSDLFSGRKLLYDSLFRICKQVQANYRIMTRTGRHKLVQTRKLKTKCSAGYVSEILEQYKQGVSDMTEALSFYELWQQDFRRALDSCGHLNSSIRGEAERNIRWIRYEKQFSIMSDRFIKRNKALLKLNTLMNNKVSKQFHKAKKIHRKFSRIKKPEPIGPDSNGGPVPAAPHRLACRRPARGTKPGHAHKCSGQPADGGHRPEWIAGISQQKI